MKNPMMSQRFRVASFSSRIFCSSLICSRRDNAMSTSPSSDNVGDSQWRVFSPHEFGSAVRQSELSSQNFVSRPRQQLGGFSVKAGDAFRLLLRNEEGRDAEDRRTDAHQDTSDARHGQIRIS